MTQNQKRVPWGEGSWHRRDKEFMTSAGGLQFGYSMSPMGKRAYSPFTAS